MGTVLRSKLDTRSDAYRDNLARMQAMWEQVDRLHQQVPSIGGQRYVERHRQRGKMLARERIEQLVDPDTPVLEMHALAGWGSEFPIGCGTVNAIGVVNGVECAINAIDMTYRGGSMNPRTIDKTASTPRRRSPSRRYGPVARSRLTSTKRSPPG